MADGEGARVTREENGQDKNRGEIDRNGGKDGRRGGGIGRMKGRCAGEEYRQMGRNRGEIGRNGGKDGRRVGGIGRMKGRWAGEEGKMGRHLSACPYATPPSSKSVELSQSGTVPQCVPAEYRKYGRLAIALLVEAML